MSLRVLGSRQLGRLLVVMLGLVLFAGAAVACAPQGGENNATGNDVANDDGSTSDAAPTPESLDGVPSYMVKGDWDAPITLYEWSDYQ